MRKSWIASACSTIFKIDVMPRLTEAWRLHPLSDFTPGALKSVDVDTEGREWRNPPAEARAGMAMQ